MKCLLILAFRSIAPVSYDSENFHPLFWMNLSLPAVSNSLTQRGAVCQKQWRVMACTGESSLSLCVLLQTALIKDCTSTTWLRKPMRKFWSWFHSAIARTLIHPHSCCKVEMLPQQLPSPTLLRSARHKWMCTHILSLTVTLYFKLQPCCYSVAVESDSICAAAMWRYTVYCESIFRFVYACCHVSLLMWGFLLGLLSWFQLEFVKRIGRIGMSFLSLIKGKTSKRVFFPKW